MTKTTIQRALKPLNKLLMEHLIKWFVPGWALIGLLFVSCIYRAGNRHPDINFIWESSVSPYYIERYMKQLDTSYPYRDIITSEVVNYPETFVPITDSTLGFKYIIEFNNMDSLGSLTENYFTLASVFDFKRNKWIKSRDSLAGDLFDKFKLFFQDSVMKKTVKVFENKVSDSLLYVEKTKAIGIKPL